MAKRIPWTLTPADLPPPRDVAREPTLRRLRENAFFRLLTIRRNQTRSSAGDTPWLLLIFLAVVCNILGIVIYIGYRLAMLGRAGLAREPTLFGLSRPVMQDLFLTSLTPQDYAIGYWGSQASRRALRFEHAILGALQLAALGGYGFLLVYPAPAPNPNTLGWLAFLSVVACLIWFYVGLSHYEPWVGLPRQARRLQRQRQLFGTNQKGRLGQFLGSEIGVFLVIMAVGAFAVPYLGVIAVLGIVTSGAHGILTHPLAPLVWGLAGWMAGLAWGQRRRNAAPALLQRMEIDFRYILFFFSWSEEDLPKGPALLNYDAAGGARVTQMPARYGPAPAPPTKNVEAD